MIGCQASFCMPYIALHVPSMSAGCFREHQTKELSHHSKLLQCAIRYTHTHLKSKTWFWVHIEKKLGNLFWQTRVWLSCTVRSGLKLRWFIIHSGNISLAPTVFSSCSCNHLSENWIIPSSCCKEESNLKNFLPRIIWEIPAGINKNYGQNSNQKFIQGFQNPWAQAPFRIQQSICILFCPHFPVHLKSFLHH